MTIRSVLVGTVPFVFRALRSSRRFHNFFLICTVLIYPLMNRRKMTFPAFYFLYDFRKLQIKKIYISKFYDDINSSMKIW